MTGAEILDAILADSGAASRRPQALIDANRALAELWDAEEWAFVQTKVNVTVTQGSMTVSALPDDLGVVVGLHRADGAPLLPIDEYRDFAASYVGTNQTVAIPEAYTVIDGAIFVGPPSFETSAAYLLIHERALTLLADDSTPPSIPEPYHYAIVAGGKAKLLKITDPGRSAEFEQDFQGAITAMRRRYVKAMRGSGEQVPAYRPFCPFS